jgi:Tfp pilus assembly protein PilX
MKNNKGFALLLTLFILVVLALVGSYLTKMSMQAQERINDELLETRAYHATLSALALTQHQWSEQPQTCPAQTIHFGSNAKALNGFYVKMLCSNLIGYPSEKPVNYVLELDIVSNYGKFGDQDFVSKKQGQWLILNSFYKN